MKILELVIVDRISAASSNIAKWEINSDERLSFVNELYLRGNFLQIIIPSLSKN